MLLPLVIQRLTAKISGMCLLTSVVDSFLEMTKAREKWKRKWKKGYEENYHKSLDYESENWKDDQKRLLQSKNIVTEAKNRRKTRLSKLPSCTSLTFVASGQFKEDFTFYMKDKEIIQDVKSIVLEIANFQLSPVERKDVCAHSHLETHPF